MKATFTIFFILNILAIILLTYSSLYAMEHRGLKSGTIILIFLTLVFIFILFKLYFRYIGSREK